MRYDQTVQVYDATLVTLKGVAKVTQWDVANKVVNLSPQIPGVIATDVIVTNGISTPTSFPALLGVPYHHNNASTGTWLGFSRSTTILKSVLTESMLAAHPFHYRFPALPSTLLAIV